VGKPSAVPSAILRKSLLSLGLYLWDVSSHLLSLSFHAGMIKERAPVKFYFQVKLVVPFQYWKRNDK
jgi:hypothetical protein